MAKELTCSICGNSWEYSKKGRPPTVCSAECKKERERARYRANAETILERNRRYREERKDELARKARDKRARIKEENPDVYKERYRRDIENDPDMLARRYAENREWYARINRANYESNREERIEYERMRRAKFKEEINSRRRELRKENPSKYRGQCADRRARELDAFVEHVSLSKLLERYGGKCGICGGAIPEQTSYGDPLHPHIDHIFPLSKGGEHSYANTQPAHSSCNVQKGNKVDGWEHIKPII